MKKMVTFIICMVTLFVNTIAYAQNNIWYLNITEYEAGHVFQECANAYDSITISKDPSCTGYIHWRVTYAPEFTTTEYSDANSITIPFDETYEYVSVKYWGCEAQGKQWLFYPLSFQDIPEPWVEETRWLSINDTLRLEVDIYPGVNILWPDSSNYWFYDITGPEKSGKVWVRMYNDCGELSDTINIYYKEEIYRATIDLETNLNKVTWQTTPEQAEYISEVKVYRDGMLVGTVPYEQGYFLDNIGSDNAARNHHLVSVTPEGGESPASYQKGTIHTTYYQDVNNNLNMTWNIPYVQQGAQGTLTYFQICKYDPDTGDLTVVDQVNSSITDYTCGVNQFDGGYAVIAAVFNDGKGLEELSFSNMTLDILGLGDNNGPSTDSGTLTVYPNPAKDRVIIEGAGTAIITNTLGQTILIKEIDGKATIELPHGLYFVKLNGATRKIVVE